MNAGPRRVLVVGATGFLGRHVADRFAANGDTVACLAIINRGQPARLARRDSIVAESAAPEALSAALSGTRFDIVVNTAAAGVVPSERDPGRLAAGNSGLLVSLIDAVSAAPPRLLIHTGSWSEYDDPEPGVPLTEESPLAPRTPYGAAKAAATRAGTAKAAKAGIPFAVLRPFQLYGPGEAPHRLTRVLLERLAAGTPVELSAGTQVRDFVHVEDAAAAFVATADGLADGTFNVCSGVGVSVREFAFALAAALGRPESLLRFGAIPLRPGETAWAVGDGQRIRSRLGWSPRISLEAGIAGIVKTYPHG